MKKTYEDAEMKIVMFAANDVITESQEANGEGGEANDGRTGTLEDGTPVYG